MSWIRVVTIFLVSSFLVANVAAQTNYPSSTDNSASNLTVAQGTSVGTTNAAGEKQTTIIDVNGNLKIIESPKAATPTVGQNTPGMSSSAPVPTGTLTKSNAPAAAAAAASTSQSNSTLPPPGTPLVTGAPTAPGNVPTPATTPQPGPAAAPTSTLPPGVPPPTGATTSPNAPSVETTTPQPNVTTQTTQ